MKTVELLGAAALAGVGVWYFTKKPAAPAGTTLSAQGGGASGTITLPPGYTSGQMPSRLDSSYVLPAGTTYQDLTLGLGPLTASGPMSLNSLSQGSLFSQFGALYMVQADHSAVRTL